MFFEGDNINSFLMEFDKNPNAFTELIEQDLQDSISMIESENIYLDYKMFKPTIDCCFKWEIRRKIWHNKRVI